MTGTEGFVGTDVSKARLDVALGGPGELFSAENDAHGIAELVTRLRRVAPELIVSLKGWQPFSSLLLGRPCAAALQTKPWSMFSRQSSYAL